LIYRLLLLSYKTKGVSENIVELNLSNVYMLLYRKLTDRRSAVIDIYEIYYYMILSGALSLVDGCVSMSVCKHGWDDLDSRVFSRNILQKQQSTCSV